MSLTLFLYKIIDHLQTFVRLKFIAVLMLNVVTLENGKKLMSILFIIRLLDNLMILNLNKGETNK